MKVSESLLLFFFSEGKIELCEPSEPEKCAYVEIDEERAAFDRNTWENKAKKKWEMLRHPVLRKPYRFQKQDYTPHEEACLSQRFKASGLQIIVKMASIELTPENPELPAGEWHVRL